MQEIKPVIRTSEWCWTLILTFIPLVNLIFLLYWTFSSSVNPNKRNFARASWLLMLIQIALVGGVATTGYFINRYPPRRLTTPDRHPAGFFTPAYPTPEINCAFIPFL